MVEERGYKRNLAELLKLLGTNENAMNFGRVPYFYPAYKFARNPTVGTSFEEIWDNSTDKTRLTTASTMRVQAGGSVEDVEGQSGAATIKIYGVDASYNLVNEELTLNGASASAASTNSYLSLYRAKVTGMSSVATARTNVGAIKLEAVTGGSVQASIPAGLGQTTMSHATVPAGYSYFVTSISAGVGKNDDAEFTFDVRPFGEAWQVKNTLKVYQSTVERHFTAWLRITEKSDIVMRAKSSAGGISVTGSYYGYLVHNSVLGTFPDL